MKNITINGVVFQPTSNNKGNSYKMRKRGILFYNEKAEPFLYLCANSESSPFFVSCSINNNKIYYMNSTSSLDDKKLGFDKMAYSARINLAREIWENSKWDKDRKSTRLNSSH